MFLLVFSVCFLICLVVAFMAFRDRKKRFTRPKGFRKYTPTPLAKPAPDCTRDAFKARKLPAEVDYVVIGSGIGGLYCAGLLAKAGRRVVVLEQHYVAGGCTHGFEDQGFEFDTGLHYVGRIEKYKALFDLVSTGRSVEWAKNGTAEDGYCYDEIKLGSDPIHRFCAGEERFVEDLVKQFPEERENIEAYVNLCKRVNKMADMYFFGKLFHPIVQWLVNRFLCQDYFHWSGKTTQEVIHGITENPKLRALLASQFGDYGLPPDRSSFMIQAGIVAHYMGGAYYPIGGSQEISRAIIPTIEAAGGRVLVKAAVSEIIVEGGRAVGVRMRDGVADPKTGAPIEVRVVRGGGVICAAGARATHNLLPAQGASRAALGYDEMLSTVRASTSHIYAFVGMDGTNEEVGATQANLWVLPVSDDGRYTFKGAALYPYHERRRQQGGEKDGAARTTGGTAKAAAVPAAEDEWEMVGAGESKTREEGIASMAAATPRGGSGGDGDTGMAALDDSNMLLFIGFPSAKDPSAAKRFPGKSTSIIISQAYREWFDGFYDEAGGSAKGKNVSGKRKDAAYDELKKKLEAKLLAGFYRHFPKAKGKVKYVNIGTPLTNQFYLGRPDSYGLEHTPEHYAGALDKLRPQTNIPGLFVTGQDVASVGIVGALNGGMITAHAVLGYGFWDLVVAKRNLVEDLMTSEKNDGKSETLRHNEKEGKVD